MTATTYKWYYGITFWFTEVPSGADVQGGLLPGHTYRLHAQGLTPGTYGSRISGPNHEALAYSILAPADIDASKSNVWDLTSITVKASDGTAFTINPEHMLPGSPEIAGSDVFTVHPNFDTAHGYVFELSGVLDYVSTHGGIVHAPWGPGQMQMVGATPAQPPPALATTVAPGAPGTFGPAGSRPPMNLGELQTITPGTPAWTVPGQHVVVGGQHYHWGGPGTGWVVGDVPQPQQPPATGHWEFDHADFQKWVGVIPAGGMPVPTLAEQGHRGPVVQIRYGAALLTDGSVVGLDRLAGLAAPAGSAVLLAGTTEQWATGHGRRMVFIAPDGTVKEVVDTAVSPLAGYGKAVLIGNMFSNSDPSHGAYISPDGSTKYDGAQAVGSGAVSTPGFYVPGDWQVDALKADGSMLSGRGTFERLWTGFHAAIGQRADGSLTAFPGTYQTAAAFTGLPAGATDVISVGITATWGDQAAVWLVHRDGSVTKAGSLQPSMPDIPGTGWVAAAGGHTGEAGAMFLRSDGHTVLAVSNGISAVPVQAAVFHAHSLPRDASNLATATLDFAALMGSTAAQLPWEIDWGDGTARTAVAVGAATGAQFTHTYTDDADHTVTIKVPGTDLIVDTIVAHKAALPQQWVFVYETATAKFYPSDILIYDGASHTFKDDAGEINVYDAATAAWVK